MTTTQETTIADLLECAADRLADLEEIRLLTGWQGSDEGLQDAWEGFVSARDTRDALVTGQLDAASYWPELVCADRHQECINHAVECADEARALLQFGPRGI